MRPPHQERNYANPFSDIAFQYFYILYAKILGKMAIGRSGEYR
jgi:hypothetical protein